MAIIYLYAFYNLGPYSTDAMTKKRKSNDRYHRYDQYSRFDFVGELLPQDESDGGEDHQRGTHGLYLPGSPASGTDGGSDHSRVLSH